MYIHNKTQAAKTYQGRPIQPDEFFLLQTNLIFEYQNDLELLADLISEAAAISTDGSTDLSATDGINTLKGIDTNPKDTDGNPISAPTFGTGLGLNAVWKGYKYQANANATNFFDEEITTQLKVLGGWYETIVVSGGNNRPVLGDYLEFSIVDKNDVLGLFAYYGLTVGVDVLELGKFLRTEMINPEGGNKREMFYVNTPQSVMTGLFFRTRYESTGPTYPVDFKIVLHYYEV